MRTRVPVLAVLGLGLITVPGFAEDWPQLQHDAARSGYSTDSLGLPAAGDCAVTWRWHPDGLTSVAGRVQPVVIQSGGTHYLCVGFTDGRMFALNADTGALLWTFTAGGPILHTAAVDASRVYFGCYDGSVYAVNLATGTQAWRYDTGDPIQTAPCLDGGRIYIGNQGGRFYALTTAGTQAWVYESGRPILTSAACAGGAVYCGDEGMYAFALDAATGSQLWRVRLRGQSLFTYAPVVMPGKGVVFYRSQPIEVFHDLLMAGDNLLDPTHVGWNSGDGTPAELAAEQASVRSHLAANPEQQSFWALDTATGGSKYAQPPPVLYTVGEGCSPVPPVYDPATNRVWVVARSRYARWDNGSIVRAYGAEPMKLNPDTGGTSLFATAATCGTGMTAVGDETAILSADAFGVLVLHRGTLCYIRHSTEAAAHVMSSLTWNGFGAGDDYSHPSHPLAYSAAGGYPDFSIQAGGGQGGGQAGAAVVADNSVYWIARFGLIVRLDLP